MNKNDKEFLVEKIRTQYAPKTTGDLEELRALDTKAKRPATVFAYIFGTISAIVMGMGMSLVMTEIGTTVKEYVNIGNPMVTGIIIGVIGMILAIVNYPIYTALLKAGKKKYHARIIELSEKILNK